MFLSLDALEYTKITNNHKKTKQNNPGTNEKILNGSNKNISCDYYRLNYFGKVIEHQNKAWLYYFSISLYSVLTLMNWNF